MALNSDSVSTAPAEAAPPAAAWFEPAAAAPSPSWLLSLQRPLALAAVAWLVLLGLALWLWMGHVVQTVLDEALSQQAATLVQVLPRPQAPVEGAARDGGSGSADADANAALRGPAVAGSLPLARASSARPDTESTLVWQWMAADGQVLRRSAQAPTQALAAAGAAEALRGTGRAAVNGAPEAAGPPGAQRGLPTGAPPPVGGIVPGLASWRVWAQALPGGAQLLVAEREGARAHATWRITWVTLLVALLVSLPVLAWLAWQWRARLLPVADLGRVLAAYEPLDVQRALPAPAWAEWAPVHAAVAALGTRVRRAAHNERAYTDHAAALLTAPLAGLEQQLAAAQREAPALMQPRLAQVRAESTRVGHGLAALQGLFHGGGELRLQPVDVAALLARMPVPGLPVQVQGSRLECADANLMAAALMALIDNARRRRATGVTIKVQASLLLLQDDGPHPSEERLSELRQTAAEGAQARPTVAAVSATTLERYARHRGGDERAAPGRDEVAEDLALALVHRVARAHGGRLVLPETSAGLALQIQLPSLAV